MITPSDIAKALINLPKADREYLQQHISTTTLKRWMLLPDFAAKVKRHRTGEEQLSGYAIFVEHSKS